MYVKKRRGYKKTGARRQGRKYVRRRVKGYTTTVRSAHPVAPRFVTKLKYSQQFVYAVGTTAVDQIINLNSIHDPDRSGIGHQPYGHDTLAGLYNRYRVYRCSGYFDISTTGNSVYHTIVPNNSTSAISNFSLASESPWAVTKTGDLSGRTRFKFNYYLPKINGSTPAQYKADDRFQAQMGNNPVESLCLHLVSLSASVSTSICVNLVMKYHVEMFDPFELAQS